MERIKSAMQGYIDEGKIAGISTAVFRHGQPIYSECYGLLDIEAGKPVQPDSIFRIYSLTKPITAVALLMLIEDGKLALDEPIAKYFPELGQMKVYEIGPDGKITYEEMQRPITIWHLITHTSGLAYGFGVGNHPVEALYQAAGFYSDNVTLQKSVPEIISHLPDLPLAFQPGTSWHYSLAYDLMGHLIELITGQPFDHYLKKRLFDPLDMPDTAFYVPIEKQARFGPMYCAPEDEKEISVVDKCTDGPFLDFDTPLSGGAGLVSTIDDYSHFLAMLANGGQWGDVRFLSADTISQMTTNQLTGSQYPVRLGDNWPGMGYGLGVGVSTGHQPEDGLPAGTYGWIGASGTGAWMFPNKSAFIIVMAQSLFYLEPQGVCRQLVYEAISNPAT